MKPKKTSTNIPIIPFTSFTPIHVTTLFIFVGCLAIVFILKEYYKTAAVLIIIKSILQSCEFVYFIVAIYRKSYILNVTFN